MPQVVRRIGFALAAVAAIAGALALLLYATFPYWFAESGSARYAEEHRLEAALALLVAIALGWAAWQCIRRSFALRWWAALAGVIVLVVSVRSFMEDRTTPEGTQPIGGNWHVRSWSEPGGFESAYHHLYYRQGLRFHSIESLAAEYRFVAPDCVIYRPTTLRVQYAMCGFRSPASDNEDPSMTEADLLARAALRPPYQPDWQSRP